MSIRELQVKLQEDGWCQNTCYPPMQDTYLSEHPAKGQCAVTALLVQKMFGGDIVKNTEFNHYFNVIESNVVDLTREQFAEDVQCNTISDIVNRNDLLKGHTKERYEILVDRVFPFISCKCITYGRVRLLEESLNSFLLQDYPGRKEMIIVNDYPLQKLHFDHPEVKIYNLDETFLTIGEKENYAVERCNGELIAVWDDDDVALSNHLMNIAKFWKRGSSVLHWHKAVYYNEPSITAITGVGNSGIVYAKDNWKQIGGHPLENAGYDISLVVRLYKTGPKCFGEPADEQVSWFYMWGGRDYHMSGQGTDTPDRENIVQRHSAHIELMRHQGNIPTGDITLKPYWKYDYQKMLNDYVSRLHNTNVQ